MHVFYLLLSMQGLVTWVVLHPALAKSLKVTALSCSCSYSSGEGDLGVLFPHWRNGFSWFAAPFLVVSAQENGTFPELFIGM